MGVPATVAIGNPYYVFFCAHGNSHAHAHAYSHGHARDDVHGHVHYWQTCPPGPPRTRIFRKVSGKKLLITTPGKWVMWWSEVGPAGKKRKITAKAPWVCARTPGQGGRRRSKITNQLMRNALWWTTIFRVKKNDFERRKTLSEQTPLERKYCSENTVLSFRKYGSADINQHSYIAGPRI